MLVGQIMQKDFITVQSSESIQEAARKIGKKHHATLIVLEKNNIRGVVTEQELAKAVSVSEAEPAQTAGTAPASRAHAVDDPRNRCCYFNDVQEEILLGR